MVKIEIYDKKTKEVVETKDLGNSEQAFRGFLMHWAMNCNSKDYDWRYERKTKSD